MGRPSGRAAEECSRNVSSNWDQSPSSSADAVGTADAWKKLELIFMFDRVFFVDVASVAVVVAGVLFTDVNGEKRSLSHDVVRVHLLQYD
jgi:hypothetical protein